jgi:hypothetical protein
LPGKIYLQIFIIYSALVMAFLTRILNLLTFGLFTKKDSSGATSQSDDGQWDENFDATGNAGASDNRDDRKRSTREEHLHSAPSLKNSAPNLAVEKPKQAPELPTLENTINPLKQPAQEQSQTQNVTREPAKEPVKSQTQSQSQTQDKQQAPEKTQAQQTDQKKETPQPTKEPAQQEKPAKEMANPNKELPQKQVKPQKAKSGKGFQISLPKLGGQQPKPVKAPKAKAAKPALSATAAPAAPQAAFAVSTSYGYEPEKKKETKKSKEQKSGIEVPQISGMRIGISTQNVMREVNVLREITDPTAAQAQETAKNPDKVKSKGKSKMGALFGKRSGKNVETAEAVVATQDTEVTATLEKNAQAQRPKQFVLKNVDVAASVSPQQVGGGLQPPGQEKGRT